MKNQNDNIPVIPFYNDWRLEVAITWQPKKGKYINVTCPRCKGKRYDVVFNMWGTEDGERGNPCYVCKGLGTVPNANMEPKPPEATAFKEAVADFVKYYYIKHRDFFPVIQNAIELQNDQLKGNRFLYCIISDLTGLDYNESKKLLDEYCKRGVIKCDTNFYYGSIVE